MIKTYGLIYSDGRKELSSVCLDEEGNPCIDAYRPYPMPDDWVDPMLVELIKADPPGPETEWESYLEWFDDRVEVKWKPINN